MEAAARFNHIVTQHRLAKLVDPQKNGGNMPSQLMTSPTLPSTDAVAIYARSDVPKRHTKSPEDLDETAEWTKNREILFRRLGSGQLTALIEIGRAHV